MSVKLTKLAKLVDRCWNRMKEDEDTMLEMMDGMKKLIENPLAVAKKQGKNKDNWLKACFLMSLERRDVDTAKFFNIMKKIALQKMRAGKKF